MRKPWLGCTQLSPQKYCLLPEVHTTNEINVSSLKSTGFQDDKDRAMIHCPKGILDIKIKGQKLTCLASLLPREDVVEFRRGSWEGIPQKYCKDSIVSFRKRHGQCHYTRSNFHTCLAGQCRYTRSNFHTCLECLAGIVVFVPKLLVAHKIADDCQIIQLCKKELQTLCQRLVVLNFSARICAG